ncbi:MAG: hypothetical protein SFV15_02970 [Polyangiaceae bacterium]|nr:hypothetical protein [Polyangiaceae bacterium]
MNSHRHVYPASVFLITLVGNVAIAAAQDAAAPTAASTGAVATSPSPVAEAQPSGAQLAPAPTAPAPSSGAPVQAEASSQPAESQAPKINVAVPAPQPEVPRTYQMHDGFYLRGNLGIGQLSTTFDDGSASSQDLEGAGFAFSFDLLAGGSPSPGLSIGGALLSSAAFSASFERAGLKADRDASLAMLGVFVDGYPKANGGWHLGGAMGLAQMKVEKRAGDLGKDAMGGLGGAAWVGYDQWVADEWSMGGLLRFAGALTSAKENSVETSASTFSTTLMFTTLYN